MVYNNPNIFKKIGWILVKTVSFVVSSSPYYYLNLLALCDIPKNQQPCNYCENCEPSSHLVGQDGFGTP